MPKWIVTLLSKKRLKLDYVLDDGAQVARVLVNKREAYWTEEDRLQILTLLNHFRADLGYAVMVED